VTNKKPVIIITRRKDVSHSYKRRILIFAIGGGHMALASLKRSGRFFAKEQKNMYVTESMKLVDSLVVAPLAAKTGSPVIITNSNLSDKQKSLADKMLVKKVTILPVEVVVRNIAAGSICKRLGLEEKKVLKKPLVEFFYKNDSLGDPLITEKHIELMGLATKQQVQQMELNALAVNEVLKELFLDIDLTLVDFKLEFGLDENEELLLADEISPDNCRLWDTATGKSFDKDLFRKDTGNISEGYTEVIKRLKGRLGE